MKSGKWYFEFEAVTTGEMRVGWARPNVRPDVELGADDLSYVFNGHRVSQGKLADVPVILEAPPFTVFSDISEPRLIPRSSLPLQGQRWHIGSEPFGRPWQSGDVVGCMIDFIDNNIMFTLNGEMLISDSGSELAFKDIEIGDGMFKTPRFSSSFIGCRWIKLE